MDSPTIALIVVLVLFVLLERFRPGPDPIAALLQPQPVALADHTELMVELVRDTLATMERIATPVQSTQPDYADAPQPQQFDMDSLDPTDTTPWLLDENLPYESRVNVAPEPATHPMGIPGLQPPLGMHWEGQQHATNLIYADGKAEHPFDRFRVDV